MACQGVAKLFIGDFEKKASTEVAKLKLVKFSVCTFITRAVVSTEIHRRLHRINLEVSTMSMIAVWNWLLLDTSSYYYKTYIGTYLPISAALLRPVKAIGFTSIRITFETRFHSGK